MFCFRIRQIFVLRNNNKKIINITNPVFFLPYLQKQRMKNIRAKQRKLPGKENHKNFILTKPKQTRKELLL